MAASDAETGDPVLDDFGRPVEVVPVAPRRRWLRFAPVGAVVCGGVAVGIGVRHTAATFSHYSFGLLGGLGIGLALLADILSLGGMTAIEKGNYSRRRTRWMWVGVITGILLGMVGMLLVMANDPTAGGAGAA
jgi:hypothetical protein